MKKWSIFLCFSLWLVGVNAQESPEEKANREADKISKALNLSSGQTLQVKNLYVEKYTIENNLKAKGSMTKANRMKNSKSIDADFNKKMSEILTEDQKKNIAEGSESMQTPKTMFKASETAANPSKAGQLPKKRSNINGMSQTQIETKAQRATDNMSQSLTLNSEQKTQIYAAHLDFYQKNAAIITQASKGSDSASLKTERKQLHENFRTKIASLLSDEQKTRHRGQRRKN